jgi:hypothetical protein
MSMASITAVTPEQIAAVRERHPGAFGTLGGQVRRWGWLVLAIVYVIGSMWYFEFGRLLDASDRVLRLLRAFVVWEDMARPGNTPTSTAPSRRRWPWPSSARFWARSVRSSSASSRRAT